MRCNKLQPALLVLMGLMVLAVMALQPVQAREGAGAATGLDVQAETDDPLVGLTIDLTAAEVDEGPTTDHFDANETVLGFTALDGAITADTITANTLHQPFEHLVESDAATENLAILLELLGVNLVDLTSDTIESDARVTGSCGDFTASGETVIEDLDLSILGETVAAGLSVIPEPDTELLNTTIIIDLIGSTLTADALVILNEQTVAGDQSSIDVNALRIALDITQTDPLGNILLQQTVDITVARSEAAFVNCTDVTLAVEKITDLDDDTATVGEPFSYTVTITNNDDVNDATAVEFTDQLPAEVDFVAFGAITGGGECEYDVDSHTIICQWPTIPADTSVSATYQVMPHTATAPDTTSNAVTVTTADNNDGEDSTSVEVTIEPTTNEADLAIEKEVSATEVTVGDEFFYTLTVTNNGPDIAILVVVTDTLPAEVEFVSATPEGVCTETAGVVSCELGNLDDQEIAIIELTVLAVGSGTASNTATVDAASDDPNPDNNTAGPVETTIQPPPDLSVTLDGPTTGVVDDPAEYTATVTNNIGEAVVDVELLIEIPDGMSLDEGSVSATGGGICTSASITCNWDSIAGDGSVVVTFTLIPNMVGTQVITATVGTEANPGLDSDQLEIQVSGAPGLPSGDPQAIPTLSHYGLLLMLALMTLLMWRSGIGSHRR